MNLPLTVALKYLFNPKKRSFINIISAITVVGLMIGTTAFLLILWTFNGLENVLLGLMNTMNPDILVGPKTGKYLHVSAKQLEEIQKIKGVKAVTLSHTETAMLENDGAKKVVQLKGVDKNYDRVIDIESVLSDGKFDANDESFLLVGSTTASDLSLGLRSELEQVTVYLPSTKKRVLGSPSFRRKNIKPTASYSNMYENDVMVPISLIRTLTGKRDVVTQIEVKQEPNSSYKHIKAELETIMSSDVTVADRRQQDKELIKLFRTEKNVGSLIAGFMILLISFNLVGCVWLIVLDKKRDISILYNMGLTAGQIRRIFWYLGLAITFIGFLLGLILALLIYFYHIYFGLIMFPEGFIIDRYPMKIEIMDFLLVILSIFGIGILASSLAANSASKNLEIA